jgi:hypothetical protein
MQLGLNVAAVALAIWCMHFAAYGLWFDRWAANVWFAMRPHADVSWLSLLSGVVTIVLVSARSPLAARLTAVIAVLALAIAELCFSTINSFDWAFAPTVNHLTGSLLAVLVCLVNQTSPIETAARPATKAMLSILAASLFVAGVFRSLRGDFFDGLLFNPLGVSDRLYSLFALTVPLVLLAFWLSGNSAVRRRALWVGSSMGRRRAAPPSASI